MVRSFLAAADAAAAGDLRFLDATNLYFDNAAKLTNLSAGRLAYMKETEQVIRMTLPFRVRARRGVFTSCLLFTMMPPRSTCRSRTFRVRVPNNSTRLFSC